MPIQKGVALISTSRQSSVTLPIPAVTLDSTFLFKMASSALQIVLSDEDILLYKANQRVVQIPTNHSENKHGKPFYVFCGNDKGIINKKSKRTCLYNRVWHQLSFIEGENFLGAQQQRT